MANLTIDNVTYTMSVYKYTLQNESTEIMAYMYVITNTINHKQYVGKTVQTIQKRFTQHIHEAKRSKDKTRPLHRALLKYGKENFTIQLLEECDADSAAQQEQYWINKLQTHSKGYNATVGGDGKLLYNYKEISDKYKELKSEQDVAKYFDCSVGTVRTACIENNVLIVNGGHAMKKKYGKPIYQYDKRTKETINSFASLSEAATYLIENNLTNCKLSTIRTHISEACRGKRKSAAGFYWSYQ